MKILIVSASLVIVFGGLMVAKGIVAPFLLAIFFAVILLPPLRWLKSKGLSEMVALLVISTAVLLCGLGFSAILTTSLLQFQQKLPSYQEKLTRQARHIDEWAHDMLADLQKETIGRVLPHPESHPPQTGEAPEEAEASEPIVPSIAAPEHAASESSSIETPLVPEFPAEMHVSGTDDQAPAVPLKKRYESTFSLSSLLDAKTIINWTSQVTLELTNLMTQMVLILVLVIFMLLEASRLPDKILAAFEGGFEKDGKNMKKLEEIGRKMWDYTVIKGWISLATGAATWIFLWFMNVEYALLWGILIFVLNFIPNVGPIIASVPPILLAGFDLGFMPMCWVILGLIAINFVIGYGVEPYFLGDGLGISALVVLLSLIFWGWLLGLVGMFLSAPLTMIVKLVLQESEQTFWIAALLSDKPLKRPEDMEPLPVRQEA